MTKSKSASTDTHTASSTNVVLLFLVIVATVILFGVVAYVYMHGTDKSDSMQNDTAVNTQNDILQEDDRTIVREDGVVVHVGTCPFKGGCGDETQVVVEKKYRAKIKSVDATTVVFLTDDNTEVKAQLAEISIEEVDLDTNKSVEVDAQALTKDDTVVINLNVETDAVENVYILSGTFH